jgi:hypothetical protein
LLHLISPAAWRLKPYRADIHMVAHLRRAFKNLVSLATISKEGSPLGNVADWRISDGSLDAANVERFLRGRRTLA